MNYKDTMIDIENKLDELSKKHYQGGPVEVSDAVIIVDEVLGDFMSDVRADVEKMREILTGVTNDTIWEK